MKSREGTVVDADGLMDELEKISYELMKEHDNELSENELIIKSKKIALAALKFYFLQFSAAKDFIFDPNASISFE
jgi:arginyl-tRNA synthetase